MPRIYYGLPTALGRARIAQALATNSPLNLDTMVFGDGQGVPVTPDDQRSTLVRQVHEVRLNRVYPVGGSETAFIAEAIIPPTVGGFVVREAGVKDRDGDLIAISNFPATEKATVEQGATQDLIVRMLVVVASTSAISMQINPAVVVASRAWVLSNFLSAPGGTTWQVLRKRSNADHDVEWFDLDIEGLSIQFDTRDELQELAEAQTVVNWADIGTSNAGYYINGARLIRDVDYAVTGDAQITLAEARDAGTLIYGVQNDQTSGINHASEEVYGLTKFAGDDAAKEGISRDLALSPKTLDVVLAARGFARRSNNLSDLESAKAAQINLGIYDYIPKAMCITSLAQADVRHAYYTVSIPANSSIMRIQWVTPIGGLPLPGDDDPLKTQAIRFYAGNRISFTAVSGNLPASGTAIVTSHWAESMPESFGFHINVAPIPTARYGSVRIQLHPVIKGKNIAGVIQEAGDQVGRATVNFTPDALSASKRQYLMGGGMWMYNSSHSPTCNLDGGIDPPISSMYASIRVEAYDANNLVGPDVVPLHFLEV
jgi:hypothetical protein